MDDNEDPNYEENERSIKPTRVNLRRLEQRYMGEPVLINNILFCYEGDKHIGNESERKQHFLQQKKTH